jgi:hypothetical protein
MNRDGGDRGPLESTIVVCLWSDTWVRYSEVSVREPLFEVLHTIMSSERSQNLSNCDQVRGYSEVIRGQVTLTLLCSALRL